MLLLSSWQTQHIVRPIHLQHDLLHHHGPLHSQLGFSKRNHKRALLLLALVPTEINQCPTDAIVVHHQGFLASHFVACKHLGVSEGKRAVTLVHFYTQLGLANVAQSLCIGASISPALGPRATEPNVYRLPEPRFLGN